MKKAFYKRILIVGALIIIYGLFDKIQSNGTIYQPDKEKVQVLRQKTDNLNYYIQILKTEIIERCSDNDTMLNCIFFQEKKATFLKQQIESYKTYILSNFSEYVNSNELNTSLSTDVQNPEYSDSWEDEYFNHISMDGAIAVLSAIQANVNYVEQTVMERIK